VKQFIGAYWGYRSSKQNTLAYEVSKTFAASTTSGRLKRAGLQGMNSAFEAHTDEVCTTFFANVNDPDAKTSRLAMALVTGSAGWSASDEDSSWGAGTGGAREKPCPQAEQVVDMITKLAKDGKANDSDYAYALTILINDKNPAPLRAKAEAGAKALV